MTEQNLKVVEPPEETPAKELKAIRITNPHWLAQMAPFIISFVEKIGIPNLTYESMYTYLAQSIQYGGDQTEFWVIVEDETPVAFAHWVVKGLPFLGTAYGEYVHSWNRKRDPVLMLVEKFIEFGKRHRCVWYAGDTINPTVFRVMRKAFNKKNVKIQDMQFVHFLGR